MSYKIKNKSKADRRIREHHTGKLHFIKAGKSITLANKPATNREDVFEITDLDKKSSSKSSKRTQKSKKTKKEEK